MNNVQVHSIVLRCRHTPAVEDLKLIAIFETYLIWLSTSMMDVILHYMRTSTITKYFSERSLEALFISVFFCYFNSVDIGSNYFTLSLGQFLLWECAVQLTCYSHVFGFSSYRTSRRCWGELLFSCETARVSDDLIVWGCGGHWLLFRGVDVWIVLDPSVWRITANAARY